MKSNVYYHSVKLLDMNQSFKTPEREWGIVSELRTEKGNVQLHQWLLTENHNQGNTEKEEDS